MKPIRTICLFFCSGEEDASRAHHKIGLQRCVDTSQKKHVTISERSVRDASVKSSRLWPLFAGNVFHLLENMRMRRHPADVSLLAGAPLVQAHGQRYLGAPRGVQESFYRDTG